MQTEAGQIDTPETTNINTTALAALAQGLSDLLRYHQLMGIDTYPLTPALKQVLQLRAQQTAKNRPKTNKANVSVHAASVVPARPRIQAADEAPVLLNLLLEEVKACRSCLLSEACQGIVPGSGQTGASLLVLGDYSLQEGVFSSTSLFGAAEDTLLWKMMQAIGLTPEEVYVTNVVKCCPRVTTQPPEESVLACRRYLLQEIALVQPRLICAMGERAAHALVESQMSIFRLRGAFHPYREDPSRKVLVTLHPRLLLKNAALKKAAWQDLQMIQRLLQAG